MRIERDGGGSAKNVRQRRRCQCHLQSVGLAHDDQPTATRHDTVPAPTPGVAPR